MASRSDAWGTGGVAPRARPPLRWALAWIGAAMDRRAGRARLAELDPRLLRDIGVMPMDALAESRKPWWRC
ncbi:DUF1127 domain-containing protein [Neoroseomonas eburnea]|nr:DUF1127 domain-containing protein [Neoroseomonas eburnea]